MTTLQSRADTQLRKDPLVEYYKQFVDRGGLRKNLRLTVEQRLQQLQQQAEASEAESSQREPPSPDQPWPAVSDCSPDRTTDPVIESYKVDVDRTLLRENLSRTHDERFQSLAAMARLAEEFESARNRKRPAP